MAAPEIGRDPLMGDWYWECSTCDTFYADILTELDAKVTAAQHEKTDGHRMNEVHESRSSRR